MFVQNDAAVQPRGIGDRARHDEDMADAVSFDHARQLVAPADPFEPAAPLQADDLRPRVHFDRRIFLDASNQVTRHRPGEPWCANDHMDTPRRRCEKDRRLPRRVAAADDHDFLSDAELRLHRRGAVVDACTFERGQVVQSGLAILRAGRDDDRARANPGAVVNLDLVMRALAGQPCGASGDDDVGAELQSLGVGAACQLQS